METRTRRWATFAFALFLLAATSASCGFDSSSRMPSQTIDADATAKELVENLVRLYAREIRNAPVRSYAIDEETIGRIGDARLEEGVRRLVNPLPIGTHAEWTFQFMDRSRSLADEPGVKHLSVLVLDLDLEYCCHLVGINLISDKGEWRLGQVYDGGFADESMELRKTRDRRKAEMLR